MSKTSHIEDTATRKMVEKALDLLKDYKKFAQWMAYKHPDVIIAEVFWADRLEYLQTYLSEHGIARPTITKSDIQPYSLWVVTPIEQAHVAIPYPWIAWFTMQGILPED